MPTSREGAGGDDHRQESVIETLLRDLAGAPDDDAWAGYDENLVEFAERGPDVLVGVAKGLLDGDPPLRVAAAHALGRSAEFAEPHLLAEIERLLIALAETETERSVMNALAGALHFAWNRSDDETFAVELRHATDQNVTLRLAAAKSLALSTPVPIPAFLTPTLRDLAHDEDTEIRSWAEHGLSYEHGWPHEEGKA